MTPMTRRRPLGLIRDLALVLSLAASLLPTAHAQGARPGMKDIRYVVLHKPGPAWLPGKTLFEQPGVREHVEHYRTLWSEGKLLLGGPHIDAKGGGMMIPTPGVTEDEMRRFANDDPAVKSGLLRAEVRPWLIGMSK